MTRAHLNVTRAFCCFCRQQPQSEEPQAAQKQRLFEGTHTSCGAATNPVSKESLILKILHFALWWTGEEISAAAGHAGRGFKSVLGDLKPWFHHLAASSVIYRDEAGAAHNN